MKHLYYTLLSALPILLFISLFASTACAQRSDRPARMATLLARNAALCLPRSRPRPRLRRRPTGISIEIYQYDLEVHFMKLCNNRIFSTLIVIFLICVCFSPVLAQEGDAEIGPDGRPAGTQPGPVPAEEPPAPASVPASDQDGGGAAAVGDVIALDQVIADDLIVQGSLCTGFDCVNNESFGFDTIRLKENNLRFKFDDTSTTAGFPANDWQLTANDSISGGQNQFSVEDVTGSKVPFKIIAGAPTSSLYVSNSGRVGLKTSNPVLNLHILHGNTPGVRLDQDGSSGFTAQVWDVAANEANFFIRDVTGGSKLSFRIQPGAPTNSITIKSSGNVGIGTWSPDGPLDIERGSQQLLLLDDNGNLAITGALTEMSDAARKENFAPVDGGDVLARLAQVPVQSWNYKGDDPSARHIGPTAQDFHAAFGLGQDDQRIAPLDTNGVALAAIQELYRRVLVLERENAELRARETGLQ